MDIIASSQKKAAGWLHSAKVFPGRFVQVFRWRSASAVSLVCDGTKSFGHWHPYRSVRYERMECIGFGSQAVVSISDKYAKGIAQSDITNGWQTTWRSNYLVFAHLSENKTARLAIGLSTGELPTDRIDSVSLEQFLIFFSIFFSLKFCKNLAKQFLCQADGGTL